MIAIEVIEIEIRQQVTIHDEEIVRQIPDQLDGCDCSQKAGFLGIRDVDSPFRPVTEIGLDQSRHVVDTQNKVGDPAFA